MLTKLSVRNFKRLAHAEIELGQAVVLIGPNNSGKTTALQALALWDAGLRRWLEKRKGKADATKRPGVAINRRDLISIPVPTSNLLWRDLHVRNVTKHGGKQETENVRIEIVVEGVSAGGTWKCGLEFDYANEESLYCRPMRLDQSSDERMPVPIEAAAERLAFLPPMSGLAASEPKWEPGRINVLLGEGRTAEVLRNLCYQVAESEGNNWETLTSQIESLFGVTLDRPEYIAERGEVTMSYKERSGVRLDISSSGRGLQQTTLLLAHLYSNPNTILLLDEPDAHLEILRQRQTYQVLTDIARAQGSQLIAASHSEVVLNEAAGKDMVIAFVGRPHRIDDRGSQVLKALKDIGFDHYYLAQQTGWALYLEGSTDLAILQSFANTLGHEAAAVLTRPFVHFVSNHPPEANRHFFGIREAKPDLAGIAIFDRLDRDLPEMGPRTLIWKRREIENYLCYEDVLLAYANSSQPNDLFGEVERQRHIDAMKESIDEVSSALKTLGKDPWSHQTKVTDDFLDPLFIRYFSKLGTPNLMRKTDYHVLATHVPKDRLVGEVVSTLDAILETARLAKPNG